MLWKIVVVFLLFFPLICWSGIKLQDGGYSGITLALHSNTSRGDCEALVDSIQKIFDSASGVLNTAIPGLTFDSIIIIIPDTWATCGSYTSVNNADNLMTWNTANIRVGESHPLFGPEPWTQQPRDCGLEGDFISFPTSWILSSVLSYHQKGLQIVHEWAKFRWGVFEEYGHYEDPIYPDSFRRSNGSWQPNYCTNSPVNGGYRSECQDSLDCDFILRESPNVESSLMAVPELKGVKSFCTSSNHNSKTPTKQNLLCNHSSSWDIIQQHPDLLNHRITSEVKVKQVNLQILRENQDFSFVIAYETSKAMDPKFSEKSYRFDFEKESIAQFILYEAPVSCRLGLVSFNSLAYLKTTTPMALSDPQTKRALAKIVLDSIAEDDNPIDLKAALRTSAEQLGSGNGLIFLLTKCIDEDLALTAEELAQAAQGNIVWILLYPTTSEKNLPLFTQVASLTGGTVMVIKEYASTEAARARQELSQAFRQLLHSRPKIDMVQVDSSECEVQEEPCERELKIPSGFDQRLFLYIYAMPQVTFEGTESLIKMTGGTCSLETYQNQVNLHTTYVFLCTADNPDYKGSINVSLTEIYDFNWIVLMEVVGQRAYNASHFNFRIFGSRNIYDLRYTEDSAPSIYVQLFYNDTEVVYANMTVDVSFNGQARISYTTIRFRDDGTSADVTGNDGIYSALLIPIIPEGEFSLTIRANDNNKRASLLPTTYNGSKYLCCGSIIPLPEKLVPVPSFRFTFPPVKAKITTTTSIDYPPGTIRDLRLDTNEDSNLVLLFTATGDDFDYGTADHYVLTYVDNGKEVSKRLKKIPSPSGAHEKIIYPSPPCNQQLVLSLYALDKSGERGQDSNIVIYYVPCSQDNGSTLSVWALALIIIACLLLIIILAVFCYRAYKDPEKNPIPSKYMDKKVCFCCSKKKKDDNTKSKIPRRTSTKTYRAPVQKIRTIADLWNFTSEETEDSSIDLSEINLDQINPQSDPPSATSTSSASSFIGVHHLINDVGVPTITPPPHYLREEDTLPSGNRNFLYFDQMLPSQPTQKKIVYNTQV